VTENEQRVHQPRCRKAENTALVPGLLPGGFQRHGVRPQPALRRVGWLENDGNENYESSYKGSF